MEHIKHALMKRHKMGGLSITIEPHEEDMAHDSGDLDKDSKEYGLAPDNKEEMKEGAIEDHSNDGDDKEIEDIIMNGKGIDDQIPDVKNMSLGQRAQMDLMKAKKKGMSHHGK